MITFQVIALTILYLNLRPWSLTLSKKILQYELWAQRARGKNLTANCPDNPFGGDLAVFFKWNWKEYEIAIKTIRIN